MDPVWRSENEEQVALSSVPSFTGVFVSQRGGGRRKEEDGEGDEGGGKRMKREGGQFRASQYSWGGSSRPSEWGWGCLGLLPPGVEGQIHRALWAAGLSSLSLRTSSFLSKRVEVTVLLSPLMNRFWVAGVTIETGAILSK